MADKDLHDDLKYLGRRVFRRKKKFQGATWTPDTSNADKEDGVYCRRCRIRHGYMKLGIQYEKTGSGTWKVMWKCPKFGMVLKEVILGDSNK